MTWDCSGHIPAGGKWEMSFAIEDIHPNFLEILYGKIADPEFAPVDLPPVPSKKTILTRASQIFEKLEGLN